MTEKDPGKRANGLFIGRDITPDELHKLGEFLLQHSGFSLSMYKEPYIQRRIATRVRAVGCQNLASYLHHLEQNEDELQSLLAALTIHVSQFFRNPSVFHLLGEKILPPLLTAARKEKRPLRLWSVGCAGGEEPYSLAILLAELKATPEDVSILGTDISRKVLEQAQAGVYNEAALREVSESYRACWFNNDNGGYRIADDLRQWVEFKYHDILSDEDFPAADLILCRNVLIYFSRTEQEKILSRFAASLTGAGHLVLGRAETMLGSSRQLFTPIYLTERIYRRL